MKQQDYIDRANAYGSGHPWYYKLGGRIKKPKAILSDIQTRGYEGYMAEDIKTASQKPEPQRSEDLRTIKAKVMCDFRRDLKRYRQLAHELRNARKENGLVNHDPCSNALHTNISLKHNHLFNDLAHLLLLDKELSLQPDLFGF